MRLMGLDVGSKTVGVAISDQLGWTSQGVEIISIDEDNKEFGLDRTNFTRNIQTQMTTV